MVKKVLLASPRGFCAGVERAIEVVEETLRICGSPIYVHHEIVHNTHVVKSLEAKGAIFTDMLEDIPTGSVTVLSAHGVSPAIIASANGRRLKVIDATCPLVTKVHLEAVRYAKEGYHIFYICHRNHPEAVGTQGWAPEHITLIESEDDARTVAPVQDKLVYLCQTTLSVRQTASIIAILRQRFPSLIAPPQEDICYATTNRQAAAQAIAKHAQLVLVVGSRTSSNSVRLVEVAKQEGVKAHLIDDASAIQPEWLEGVKTVGLTSGASAPESLVQNVIDHLQKAGATKVKTVELTKERITFTLPKELVQLRVTSEVAKVRA